MADFILKDPNKIIVNNGGDEGGAVVLKLNSGFNKLLFQDDKPVTPSNFPYDKVPNVYLVMGSGSFLSCGRTNQSGTTYKVDFVGINYNTTSSVYQNVIYTFKSTSESTQFSMETSRLSPIVPTIGPNDGGKYLRLKDDRSALEWVTIE